MSWLSLTKDVMIGADGHVKCVRAQKGHPILKASRSGGGARLDAIYATATSKAGNTYDTHRDTI
jgi:hypothetical protein